MRDSYADLITELNNLIKLEHDEPLYRGDAEHAKMMLDLCKQQEAYWRARFRSKKAEMLAYLQALPEDYIPPQEVLDLLEGY